VDVGNFYHRLPTIIYRAFNVVAQIKIHQILDEILKTIKISKKKISTHKNIIWNKKKEKKEKLKKN